MILYISNVLTLTSRVVGVCVRVRACVCMCSFCDHKTRGGSVGASGLGSGKTPHDTSLRPLCRWRASGAAFKFWEIWLSAAGRAGQEGSTEPCISITGHWTLLAAADQGKPAVCYRLLSSLCAASFHWKGQFVRKRV